MDIRINSRVVVRQSSGNKITKFLKRAELVVVEQLSLFDYIATLQMPLKV